MKHIDSIVSQSMSFYILLQNHILKRTKSYPGNGNGSISPQYEAMFHAAQLPFGNSQIHSESFIEILTQIFGMEFIRKLTNKL